MHIRIKRLLKASAGGVIGVMAAWMVAGCEWGDRTITLVRPDTENLQVAYSDTVTVRRSTVIKDSIYTATGPIMTGFLKDDLTGSITARGYFIPTLTAAMASQQRAVYDSIVLASKYSYHYGDTTALYRLSVHELLEDISTFQPYNTRGANYEKAPIGERIFRLRPRSSDSLRVRLSDELGNKLFTEASSNRLRSQEELLKNFKGVALEGESLGAGGFLGFDRANTRITLYYHVDGPDGKARYTIDMTAGNYYSQIVNDRQGTPFEGLITSRNRVLSDLTEGVSVIQGGAGLMTRLDFPYLHQFDFDQGKVIVNRAFLRVQLPRNPENPSMRPPRGIALYPTGVNNEWELSSQDSEIARAVFVNDSIHNERYYEMDVTGLVTSLVQGNAASSYGFLLGPLSSGENNGTSTYTTSMDRLILRQGSVKLKVYYTTLLE